MCPVSSWLAPHVVCGGLCAVVTQRSGRRAKLSCGTLCFPCSVKMFFTCAPYVAYRVFFLLYFSLNVNNDSVCANVVRKKKS